MSDITISYKGNSIATMDASGTKTLLTEGKYCEDDIIIDYTQPSGGGGNWTLIGTKVFTNVAEYTDTTTSETFDTEINIKDTDYAVTLIVVTCDSAITTSTEWGMTISLGGRYTSNGNYLNNVNLGQKGSSTLSKSAMVNATAGWSGYGVTVNSNASTIKISRKCNATNCPKIRAGNYTVKVYGMTAF